MPRSFWLDEGLVEVGINQPGLGSPVAHGLPLVISFMQVQMQRELGGWVEICPQSEDE